MLQLGNFTTAAVDRIVERPVHGEMSATIASNRSDPLARRKAAPLLTYRGCDMLAELPASAFGGRKCMALHAWLFSCSFFLPASPRSSSSGPRPGPGGRPGSYSCEHARPCPFWDL